MGGCESEYIAIRSTNWISDMTNWLMKDTVNVEKNKVNGLGNEV